MYCYKFCSTVFADPSGREARGKDWQKPCWGVFDWQAQGLQVLSANSGDFFTLRLTDFRWKHATPSWTNFDLCYEASWKKDFVEEERPPWKTSQNSFAKRLNWVNCVTRLFPSQAHDQPMWSSFFLQGTKACKDREVPTLQQKREREKSKAGGKADSGEKVTYRREWTSGSGKPEL